MKPIPIAKYLNRNSAPNPPAGAPPQRQSVLLQPRRTAFPQSIAAQITEAYERGRDEARAAALVERAVASEMDLVQSEQRAAAERQEIRAAEIPRISAMMENGLKEIEESVCAAVARILAPYLKRQQVGIVSQALLEHLQKLFRSNGPAIMNITGPRGELEALKACLEPFSIAVEYAVEDGVDIAIRVDETTIKTRLGEWINLIDSVVD